MAAAPTQRRTRKRRLPVPQWHALKIIVQPQRDLRVLATLKRDQARHRVASIAIGRLANDFCL